MKHVEASADTARCALHKDTRVQKSFCRALLYPVVNDISLVLGSVRRINNRELIVS